jgi:hypothetical protein
MRWLVVLASTLAACAASGSAVTTPADGGSDAASDAHAEVQGDAALDDDSANDAAATDADALDAGSTLACPPGSVAAFAPTWKPPKPLHATACSPAEAELNVNCAFDPSSNPSVCDAYLADASSSNCTLCVLTDDFDTTYGPLVMHGAYADLNLGGCIAQASGDTSATGCGAKVQAIGQCQAFACSACPDPSSGTKAMNDYLACLSAAMSTVCKDYVKAAACADALIAPDAAAEVCASGGNTFLGRARALAQLFCSR